METESVKDTLKDKAENIINHVEDIADTFYKLTIVNITQKATNIASVAITAIAICLFGLFALFFGGLALAWWVGDLVNSRAGGFLLVAAFFGIVMAVIIGMRKKIVFPFIRNLIIRKLYD